MTDGSSGPAPDDDVPGKEDLYKRLHTLTAKYGWNAGGHANITSVAKLLTTNSCERRIESLLGRGTDPVSGDKFDSIYREKSEFATVVILDHLKRRLTDTGYNVRLATETRDRLGIYDITIATGSPCVVFAPEAHQLCRIEVKAALGIPFEQSFGRYFFNTSPLIVARLLTGHVGVFRPAEMAEYAEFYASNLSAKAERILDGNYFTLPGRYCAGCPAVECAHHVESRWNTKRMVTIRKDEFQDDVQSFLSNLRPVSEKVADAVIALLRENKVEVAA